MTLPTHITDTDEEVISILHNADGPFALLAGNQHVSSR